VLDLFLQGEQGCVSDDLLQVLLRRRGAQDPKK